MASNNSKLSLDELAQNYGYAANFFGSDPELENLIQQATKNQWSVAMFQARFMASGWYRNHAASVRQWIEQSQRDPASTGRQIDQKQLDIAKQAYNSGIAIPSVRTRQMAQDALMWGWSDSELQNAIASEFKYQPGGTQGLAATNEDQIRKAAGDMGMTLSDSTVADWDQHMLKGDYTLDNINGFVRNMAMSKYPGMKTYLDQGFTVRQVADPYVQSYSSILETPSQTVDLNDPLIQKALQGTQAVPGGQSTSPGGSGLPQQPTSVYDFEKQLRNDPRWLQTKNAQQSMMTAAQGILKNWGLYS
jgi:hypothetical protein